MIKPNRISITLLALGLILSIDPAHGATLKPETLTAWEAYVEGTRLRVQSRVGPEGTLLTSDDIPGQTNRLRSGEILVAPFTPSNPRRIASGLIHDWNGAAFIPHATLPEVVAVVRDYAHYREIYQPAVIESRIIATTPPGDQFSVVLMNRSLVSKTALDLTYRTIACHVDDRRWYSVAEATSIQEIEDYGGTSQHRLPMDEGTGLIWRMLSVIRLEERDGGVYIEVEAVALSREVPASLRWLVDPIIRRVSREALRRSLQQMQDAVRSRMTQGQMHSSIVR